MLASFLEPAAQPGPLAQAVLWDDFVVPDPGSIPFAQLPFDHPIYILYSSGTTGVPKAIVHGAGGTLLQHLKELLLHTDLKPEDRIFYFTTCGWMMWNWQVSALATGATLVVYDGSPFHPDGNRLFDLAQQDQVTVFGTSAKYIDAVKKAGLEPGRTHDLSALRAILSTGSPLVAESFDFVYRSIKRGPAPRLDLGWYRHRVVLCARQSGRPGVARRAADPGPRHGRRGVERAGPAGGRRARRAGLREAVPVDARGVLERSGRQPLPRRLFRALPRRLDPWRPRRAHGA